MLGFCEYHTIAWQLTYRGKWAAFLTVKYFVSFCFILFFAVQCSYFITFPSGIQGMRRISCSCERSSLNFLSEHPITLSFDTASNKHCRLFLIRHLCVLYSQLEKCTGHICTFYVSNDCSTIGDFLVWFRVAWGIRLESYRHKHALQLYFDTTWCAHISSSCIHCSLVLNYPW